MADMVVKKEQSTTLSNLQPCVEQSPQVLIPEPPRDERLQPEPPSGGPIQQKDPTETSASESITENRIDQTSAKGLFGWTTIDHVNIPYLLRFEKKYLSVRMVEMKLLSRFPSSYPEDLQNRPPVVSHYLTPAEAKLLNEINLEHCAGEYGLETFTTEDLTVSHHDFEEFYNAVKKEFPTTDRQKAAAECSKVDGGWLQINNTVIPYVSRRQNPYVPLSVVMYAAGFLTNVQIEGETPSEEECKFLNDCCLDEGLNFSFARKSKLVSLELVHKTSKEKVTMTKLPKTNPFSYAQYRDETSPVTHDSAKLCNAELPNTRTNSQPSVTQSGPETGSNTQAQPRNPQHGIGQFINPQHSATQQNNRQASKPQCEVSSTRGNLTGITSAPGFGQMPYPNSAQFNAAIVNRIPTTAPPPYKEANKQSYEAGYSLPHLYPFYANAAGMKQSFTQRAPLPRLSTPPSSSPPSLIPISEIPHSGTSLTDQRSLPNVSQPNSAQNPGYPMNVRPNNTPTVVSPIATNISTPSAPSNPFPHTTIPRNIQADQLNLNRYPVSNIYAQSMQSSNSAAFSQFYPNQHPNQQANQLLNQHPNQQANQHLNQHLNQQANQQLKQHPIQPPSQRPQPPNQPPNQQAVLRPPQTQNVPSHSQCNNGQPFTAGPMVASSHLSGSGQLPVNTNHQQNASYCNFRPNSARYRRFTRPPEPSMNINPPRLGYTANSSIPYSSNLSRQAFTVKSNIGMVGALGATRISPDLITPTDTNIRVDPNAAGNLSGLHPPGRLHGGSMQEPHRNISGQNGNMSVSRTMLDRTPCTAAPVVAGTSIAQVPSHGIPESRADGIGNPMVTGPQFQSQPFQPWNNPNYQNCPPNSAPQRPLGKSAPQRPLGKSAPQRPLGNSAPQRMLGNRGITEPPVTCPVSISDRTGGMQHLSEGSDDANLDHLESFLTSGSQSSADETISTRIGGVPFSSSNFLGRSISYMVISGKRFALLENIANIFFHCCTLDEFQHALNSVLKIPLTDLTDHEEKAFIKFYGLPTKALICKKVVDLEIFEKYYTHLLYIFNEKYKNGSRKNTETSKAEDCPESSRSQTSLKTNHSVVPIKQEPDAARKIHTGVKRSHPDTSISPPAKRTMLPLESLQEKVARYSPTGSLPPPSKPSHSNSLHSPVLMTTESTGLENTSVLVSQGKVIPNIVDKHASVASTNISAVQSLPNNQRKEAIDNLHETVETIPNDGLNLPLKENLSTVDKPANPAVIKPVTTHPVARPDSHNTAVFVGASESTNRLPSYSRECDKESSILDKTKSHLVSERLECSNSGKPISSPTCHTADAVDKSKLPVAHPVEVVPVVRSHVTNVSAAQPMEVPVEPSFEVVPVQRDDDISVCVAQPVEVVPAAQPVTVAPVAQPLVEDVTNVSAAQLVKVPGAHPVEVAPVQPDDDINVSAAQPVDVVPVAQPVDVVSAAQPVDVVPVAQPVELVPVAHPAEVVPVGQPVKVAPVVQLEDSLSDAQPVQVVPAVEEPLSPPTMEDNSEIIDNSKVLQDGPEEAVSTLSNDEEAPQLPLLITNVQGREEDSDSVIMDLTSSPGPNNDEDGDVVQISEEPEGRSVSRRRKRGYRQVMGTITAKPSIAIEDDDDADCVIVSAVGKIICIE